MTTSLTPAEQYRWESIVIAELDAEADAAREPRPATAEIPAPWLRPPVQVSTTRYVVRPRWGMVTRRLIAMQSDTRLLILLVVAAVAAIVTGMFVLEANWSSEFLGTAR